MSKTCFFAAQKKTNESYSSRGKQTPLAPEARGKTGPEFITRKTVVHLQKENQLITHVNSEFGLHSASCHSDSCFPAQRSSASWLWPSPPCTETPDTADTNPSDTEATLQDCTPAGPTEDLLDPQPPHDQDHPPTQEPPPIPDPQHTPEYLLGSQPPLTALLGTTETDQPPTHRHTTQPPPTTEHRARTVPGLPTTVPSAACTSLNLSLSSTTATPSAARASPRAMGGR